MRPQRPSTAAALAEILLVEDDTALRELVIRTLQVSGYAATGVSTVADALAHAVAHQPDLAVVDLRLPDGSGIDLLHRLRDIVPELPIVVLTARDGLDDRLTGFAMGADDYVTKPFAVVELVARVNAVLRRTHPATAVRAAGILTVGDLVLDDDAHVVTRGGAPIGLTATEYRLLRYLMANAGRVLSRSELLDNVWGYSDATGSAVVEKFISQVRKKVDIPGTVPLIAAVRSFGYVLRAGASTAEPS